MTMPLMLSLFVAVMSARRPPAEFVNATVGPILSGLQDGWWFTIFGCYCVHILGAGRSMAAFYNGSLVPVSPGFIMNASTAVEGEIAGMALSKMTNNDNNEIRAKYQLPGGAAAQAGFEIRWMSAILVDSA